jgi:hypothetical protein
MGFALKKDVIFDFKIDGGYDGEFQGSDSEK